MAAATEPMARHLNWHGNEPLVLSKKGCKEAPYLIKRRKKKKSSSHADLQKCQLHLPGNISGVCSVEKNRASLFQTKKQKGIFLAARWCFLERTFRTPVTNCATVCQLLSGVLPPLLLICKSSPDDVCAVTSAGLLAKTDSPSLRDIPVGSLGDFR